MPRPRLTEKDAPPKHLQVLARRREEWKIEHDIQFAEVQRQKNETIRNRFKAQFPDWDKLKSDFSERHQAIIEMAYGLDGGECLSLSEIGRRLPYEGKAVTRQAIQQSKNKIIKKLVLMQCEHVNAEAQKVI